MREIRNVDQLRQSIDQGQTGDKVNFPDPAAAPFGTDAEAGGFSPSEAEVALDAAATVHRQSRPALRNLGLYIYLLAIALIVGLILVVFSVAR